jgi:hypothetical protein
MDKWIVCVVGLTNILSDRIKASEYILLKLTLDLYVSFTSSAPVRAVTPVGTARV